MIYQCYKHKGDFMNDVCREEPQSRIDELYGKMNALGNEVVQTLGVVTKKKSQYYGIDSLAKESDQVDVKGAVNQIDWMIEDIRKMVGVIREYVETL
jgi:hypothetical protein